MNYLTFGAFDSRKNANISIFCRNPIPTPERRFQRYPVPLKDGFKIVDDGAWDNVNVMYTISVSGAQDRAIEAAEEIRDQMLTVPNHNELYGTAMYQELADSFSTFHRQARLSKFSLVEYSECRGIAIIDVVFDSLPIRSCSDPKVVRAMAWKNEGPGIAYPIYMIIVSAPVVNLKATIAGPQNFQRRDVTASFTGGGMGSQFMIDAKTGKFEVYGSGSLSVSGDWSVPKNFTVTFAPDAGLQNGVDITPRRFSL